MDPVNMFAGGAAVGLLIACWNYIKGIAWRFASLLIQRVELRELFLATMVISHIIDKYKRSRAYDRVYAGGIVSVQKFKDIRKGHVAYELFGHKLLVFWIGWFPLLVYSGAQKSKDPNEESDEEERVAIAMPLVFTFVRGTIDLEKIIVDATNAYNELSWQNLAQQNALTKRHFIRHVPALDKHDVGGGRSYRQEYGNVPWYHQKNVRLLGFTPDELGNWSDSERRALDTLIFPAHIRRLIDELTIWRNSREWYQARGIPWKRGWLLYGPPGTGKTALARAFAEDLDLPVFVYNLAELGNIGFQRAWRNMQGATPCIALIEDMDNIFHGRRNIAANRFGMFGPFRRFTADDDGVPTPGDSKKKKLSDDEEEYLEGGLLTFDSVLNTLDGIERSDGIFTIITTNDITKIDPALGIPRKLDSGATEFISSRPGRIDRAIELTYMTDEDKRTMANRILMQFPEQLAAIYAHIASNTTPETPAQFQERCAQHALAAFWAEEVAKRTAEEVAKQAAALEAITPNAKEYHDQHVSTPVPQ